MSDTVVEMQRYQLLRWRCVAWRRQLNDILNGRTIVEDIAVLYLTATRHSEAFLAALEARRLAYAGQPAC